MTNHPATPRVSAPSSAAASRPCSKRTTQASATHHHTSDAAQRSCSHVSDQDPANHAKASDSGHDQREPAPGDTARGGDAGPLEARPDRDDREHQRETRARKDEHRGHGDRNRDRRAAHPPAQRAAIGRYDAIGRHRRPISARWPRTTHCRPQRRCRRHRVPVVIRGRGEALRSGTTIAFRARGGRPGIGSRRPASAQPACAWTTCSEVRPNRRWRLA